MFVVIETYRHVEKTLESSFVVMMINEWNGSLAYKL